MLCVKYQVAPSLIPGAGQGLFVAEPVNAGKIIIAPSHIDQTVPLQHILVSQDEALVNSSIRWFEDHCTVSPDWPDECYVNHAFEPSGLWHLGFIFAARDLQSGEEVTVDYRHLIGPGVMLPFTDSASGRPIVGLGWEESVTTSAGTLLEILRTTRPVVAA